MLLAMLYLVLVLSIVAVLLGITALTVALSAQSQATRASQIAIKQGNPANFEAFSVNPGNVWVVVNPTKVDDLDSFRKKLTSQCLTSGYPEPKFVETTEEDPGQSQARRAAEEGTSLVLCAGGDGTLREVAAGLAGSQTALGVIPMGTGNLMARNLNLPIGSISRAVEVALTGRDSWIDLGYLKVEDGHCHPFLVMAGIGFDGDIMKGASDTLKGSIGWGAYFLSGMQASVRPASHVEVQLGEEKKPRHAKVRTLLFASCGELVGGITLLPDANPRDGWLDVMFLSVRGWLFGWLELVSRVLMRAFSSKHKPSGVVTKMDVVRARTASVHVLDGPREVQIDGDPIGTYSDLEVELKHHAVKIRVA